MAAVARICVLRRDNKENEKCVESENETEREKEKKIENYGNFTPV